MTSVNREVAVEPLELDEASLEKHFGAISSVFQNITGKRALKFGGVIDTDPVEANLSGQGCRYAHTARRSRTPVVLLVNLKDDVCAWMGVFGQWDVLEARSKRGKRKLRFASLALSVYFGTRDDENKLLMFRAEWSGARPAGDGTYTFAPPKAGHPHWHFDALSSMSEMIRKIRDESRQCGAVENAELYDPHETDAISRVFALSMDRIHFASSAQWWKAGAGHAHTPARQPRTGNVGARMRHVYQERSRLLVLARSQRSWSRCLKDAPDRSGG